MRLQILDFFAWGLFLSVFTAHFQPAYATSDLCLALDPSEIADYCLEWEVNGYQNMDACINENVSRLLQCGCDDSATSKPVGTLSSNENIAEFQCQLFSPNKLGTVKRE